MWAAKEAALKCLRQLDPATPFHPRGLIVALSSPRRATVGSADRSLRISLDRTPARVHAVARLAGATCATERAHVRQRPAGETETTGSRALRAWCSARIAEWLALDEDAVRLSPAGGSPLASGAPAATADGRPLPVELSLSHDGRWHGAVLRLSSVVQQLPA